MRLLIAFKDLVDPSIAPQIVPHWLKPVEQAGSLEGFPQHEELVLPLRFSHNGLLSFSHQNNCPHSKREQGLNKRERLLKPSGRAHHNTEVSE